MSQMSHMSHMKHLLRPPSSARRRPQAGVTMLFGLIAMALMMIGAAAMVRSMNTSLFNAGNLGFKRDLTNQAERAANTVMTLVNTGALGTDVARQSDNVGQNYSATILATNAQGIPNVLVDDSQFSSKGSAGNDISVTDQAVVVRYLVDRLCATTGAADVDRCTMSDAGAANGTTGNNMTGAEHTAAGVPSPLPRQVVYRLSVRVSGPRDTQAYFQVTFTI